MPAEVRSFETQAAKRRTSPHDQGTHGCPPVHDRLRQRIRHARPCRARSPSAGTRRRSRRSASTPSSSRAPPSPRRARENRRSWLYRMRPSASTRAFRRIDGRGCSALRRADEAAPSPNRLRWNPLALPDEPTPDFVDGLVTLRRQRRPGDRRRHRHPPLRREPLDGPRLPSTPTASC